MIQVGTDRSVRKNPYMSSLKYFTAAMGTYVLGVIAAFVVGDFLVIFTTLFLGAWLLFPLSSAIRYSVSGRPKVDGPNVSFGPRTKLVEVGENDPYGRTQGTIDLDWDYSSGSSNPSVNSGGIFYPRYFGLVAGTWFTMLDLLFTAYFIITSADATPDFSTATYSDYIVEAFLLLTAALVFIGAFRSPSPNLIGKERYSPARDEDIYQPMVTCSYCGGSFDRRAANCPHCGAPTRVAQSEVGR